MIIRKKIKLLKLIILSIGLIACQSLQIIKNRQFGEDYLQEYLKLNQLYVEYLGDIEHNSEFIKMPDVSDIDTIIVRQLTKSEKRSISRKQYTSDDFYNILKSWVWVDEYYWMNLSHMIVSEGDALIKLKNGEIIHFNVYSSFAALYYKNQRICLVPRSEKVYDLDLTKNNITLFRGLRIDKSSILPVVTIFDSIFMMVLPNDIEGLYSWSDAKMICDTLNSYGYNDWILPDTSQLSCLWSLRNEIRGFSQGNYWSSNDIKNDYAWNISFYYGSKYRAWKLSKKHCRCIRLLNGS